MDEEKKTAEQMPDLDEPVLEEGQPGEGKEEQSPKKKQPSFWNTGADEESSQNRPDSTSMSMGVSGEEYDILPDLPEETAAEIEEEVKDKEAIDILYSFKGEDVKEGLKFFQRETLYRKNWIYTGILVIIFVVYLVSAIRNPADAFSMFLAAVCVAVICFLWYLPKKHIRKTAKTADENDFSFHMGVYDTCVRIIQENGSFLLHYGVKQEISKVIESRNLFLLCCGKERVFIIPKRCLEEGAEDKLRQIWKTAMGNLYSDKSACN